MTQDWSNPETVKMWDIHGNDRNPVRFEQLDILVSILADRYIPGHWILDLGYGSGQVEKVIFERIPDASVVGVDNSEAMMKLADERLKGYPNKFEGIKHNLSELHSLEIPNYKYQFVIACQSLHHLSKPQMSSAYQYIYKTLEPGGLFLLLDKFQVETEGIWKVMKTVWNRQDQLFGSIVSSHEGDSFEEHERRNRDWGDFPVPLNQHLSWLHECGL